MSKMEGDSEVATLSFHSTNGPVLAARAEAERPTLLLLLRSTRRVLAERASTFEADNIVSEEE